MFIYTDFSFQYLDKNSFNLRLINRLSKFAFYWLMDVKQGQYKQGKTVLYLVF